jgi:hypothetical protein
MRKVFVFVLLSLMWVSFTGADWKPYKEEGGSVVFSDLNQITTAPYTIYSIAWSSSTGCEIANGDSMVISDSSSENVIASSIAASDHDEQMFIYPEGRKVNGLTATTLSGGRVYINGRKR